MSLYLAYECYGGTEKVCGGEITGEEFLRGIDWKWIMEPRIN
jgi:hypothetical protein